ncbi:MAG: hypothetical protein ACPGSC_00010 [Granulosicoccaceae bacterium]
MKHQSGISTAGVLIATLASLTLVGLVWLALHYSDKRIWIGIGLVMALSPFALVWRLVRAEKKKPDTQKTE